MSNKSDLQFDWALALQPFVGRKVVAEGPAGIIKPHVGIVASITGFPLRERKSDGTVVDAHSPHTVRVAFKDGHVVELSPESPKPVPPNPTSFTGAMGFTGATQTIRLVP